MNRRRSEPQNKQSALERAPAKSAYTMYAGSVSGSDYEGPLGAYRRHGAAGCASRCSLDDALLAGRDR